MSSHPNIGILEQPLSDDDIQLIRRCCKGGVFRALFGLMLFLVFIVAGVTTLLLTFDSSTFRKVGILMPLMSALLLGLAGWTGLQLSKIPRSRLLIKRALAGGIPKQVVTDRLQSIQPGDKPGVRYILDTMQFDVALPNSNEITTDTNIGMRVDKIQAVTDELVTLHLIHLLKGHQPLLLSVDYHGQSDTLHSTEPLSKEFVSDLKNAPHSMRMILWSIACAFVVLGFFIPPMFFVVPALMLVSIIPGPGDREIEKMTHKIIISGVVNEILTYDNLDGSCCYYRIGGMLYPGVHENPRYRLGQKVTLEFLDYGMLILKPLG